MRVKFNRRWPRPPPIRCRYTFHKMSPDTISGKTGVRLPVRRLQLLPRVRRFSNDLHCGFTERASLRAEDGRASYIGIRKATYRAEGALYLRVHHRERGCLEIERARTQRFK